MNGVDLFLKQIDFSKLDGLIPAVAQDYFSGEVLMLAFMNEEALKKTVETGVAHYFSRSRHKLWKKGETSGNIQSIKEIFFDCDGDSILLKVVQKGVACHTGHRTCFYSKVNNSLIAKNNSRNQDERKIDNNNKELFYSLKLLYDLIASRKGTDPNKSYVARLLNAGAEKIGKKLQEESLEVILSVISGDKDKIVYELADLIFFYIVMSVYSEVDFFAIISELKGREGISGLDEKKSR
ncbi:MAG TPA: bifunctional phosphoribosyl-AMP cyclohydrolase/phosphoribosyl-ATP diphosphatase HisIE [bacterium]|nr:bifunctional phosphoribosyl-AMP cyclohydrolase/phosphoribosyl-ATP diphosphatase HisIE [bacterium]